MPTTNESWLNRSLAAIWHPCTQMKHHQLLDDPLPLVPIARAEGVWLYDFDGNRYLDAVSSWWVNLLGHANPRLNAALQDQLAKLSHVMLAGFTHQPVIELSEALSQSAPSGLGHCFYASDGASATEIALKMSFHYWYMQGASQKTRFVSLANGYHGESIGALGVTDVALFQEVYKPLLQPGQVVMSPDWRLAEAGETPLQRAQRAAADLEHYLAQHHQVTAALIVEPLVQGAAGMAMYHPEYLRQARVLCTKYEVHLIADEIMTGFGRTGTLFACEQAEITPDFLLLSKGITGGYLPLALVMTTDQIYRAFWDDDLSRGFLHSHSYTGNALACRVALEVLQILQEDQVIARNQERVQLWQPLLAPLLQHPRVLNFRQMGMIWAFEVKSDRPNLAKWFFQQGLAVGILLRPIGKTVYWMPPYILTDEDFAWIAHALCQILDRLD